MEIIFNDNSRKMVNGYFERTFRWRVEKIAQRPNANGFIVQKITRRTTASEEFWARIGCWQAFNHEYVEAWKVRNGIIVFSEGQDYGFDDCWIYNSKIPSFDAMLSDIADKYLTHGLVKICGEVYWLDENDSRTLMLENYLQVGKVRYAGNLLSTEKFDAIDKSEMIDSITFQSSWDFSNDTKFIEGIRQIYLEANVSPECRREDIDNHFSKLPVYEELLKRFATE